MKRDLLLVIDMQNVYAKGGEWHCPNTDKAAMRIKYLIQESNNNIDIIFTRFLASGKPEGIWKHYNMDNEAVCNDTYANEMLSIFSDELNKYPLLTKSVYSSLAIEEVKEAAKNAKRVIVTGVVAECCVLATAMALIDEGNYVIYLTDAVAGINDAAEKSVECILSGLEPLHVQRMTVSEYIKSMK